MKHSTRKVWLCCGILLCLESEQRVIKSQEKGDLKEESQKRPQVRVLTCFNKDFDQLMRLIACSLLINYTKLMFLDD